MFQVAGGVSLAVHSAILRYVSPPFTAMFASGMAEATSGRLTLADSNYNAVRAMYEFFIKGGKEPEVRVD